ncbi:MAG: hypothetical protein ACTSVL_04445 [Promethearchaeota archaeon]
MFKINFDMEKAKNKKIISPEDLLPKKVETTDGKISPFNPQFIVDSLIKETGLDQEKAIKVATDVLRRLSSLNMDFIAAPHLRELICGELTAKGLHEYRCRYTRLGIPIYDIREMLKKKQGKTFLSLLAAQVIEQYVHLDRLDEGAQDVIDMISEYATGLEPENRTIILDAMAEAIKLYAEKKAKKLV